MLVDYRLENALRSFATLTKGDVISIHYNDKDFELCILETKPGNAVSIIECDMDVDFAPPVGYVEPTFNKKTSQLPAEPVSFKYVYLFISNYLSKILSLFKDGTN